LNWKQKKPILFKVGGTHWQSPYVASLFCLYYGPDKLECVQISFGTSFGFQNLPTKKLVYLKIALIFGFILKNNLVLFWAWCMKAATRRSPSRRSAGDGTMQGTRGAKPMRRAPAQRSLCAP
jgi:hypothetical protein